ncbi:MAG: hypothetical protein JWP87_3983 [Labilithrix sp.]|nr:hypothetical protein [Labilithrix sp.]
MAIAHLIHAPIGAIEHADALLEVAFLMGAVDGHLADEELALFAELVATVRGRAVTKQETDELMGRFILTSHTTILKDRLGALAKVLPPSLRETAFKVAVGLSHVDEETTAEEDELVGLLAVALDLRDRAETLADEARQAAGAD